MLKPIYSNNRKYGNSIIIKATANEWSFAWKEGI